MVYPKPITFVEKVETAAGHVAGLPGVPDAGEGITYRSIFRGAQNPWPNDEVGWTKVQRTKMVGYGDERRAVKCTRRDHSKAERKYAGWNLDLD